MFYIEFSDAKLTKKGQNTYDICSFKVNRRSFYYVRCTAHHIIILYFLFLNKQTNYFSL